jgi:hypothetical protein
MGLEGRMELELEGRMVLERRADREVREAQKVLAARRAQDYQGYQGCQASRERRASQERRVSPGGSMVTKVKMVVSAAAPLPAPRSCLAARRRPASKP